MPVDIRAAEYRWYMVDPNADETIVRYVWKPEGPISSSLAIGTFAIQTRETSQDPWETKNEVEMMWITAESFTRREGFDVQIPVYRCAICKELIEKDMAIMHNPGSRVSNRVHGECGIALHMIVS